MIRRAAARIFMLNLGLIGFGRFGQFAAAQLRTRLHIFVWDIRDQRKKAGSLGLTWGTLEEAASCRVVFLAVPISEMPAVLGEVAPFLRPDALLLDACSVKILPARWMEAAVPGEVDIIGSHPLFGPESGKAGIEGHSIVICPVRLGKQDRVERVEQFLTEMGLHVIVSTPEEHDRQMARAQALTHFVARGLDAAGLSDQEMKTPSFERLLSVVHDLRQDAPELFHDMHRYNPFAAEARREFCKALESLERQLDAS